MIGRTNAGSGSGRCVALVRVLYPAGTACTITNGSIIYSADASGDFLFVIPSAGSWTVSGVDSKGAAKNITLTIARGDAKTVTLDTLIPPAYRSLYWEVEYIQMTDNSSSFLNGNIPTGVILGPGAWDIEMESLWVKNPTNNAWTALTSSSSRLSLGSVGDGRIKLSSNNDYLSSETLVTEVDRTYKIHWSSGDEEKKVRLVVDNEELISSTTAQTLLWNWQLYIGVDPDLSATTGWPGKYRAVKVTKDGILLHQFIPAKRISDGMPGYFDLLTNEFKQGYQGTDGTLAEVLEVMTPGPVIGT